MEPSVRCIGHALVEVTSLEPAIAFYRDGLGLRVMGTDCWPACDGHHAVLWAGGSNLVLVETATKRDVSSGGTHQAYRISRGGLKGVAERLKAMGCEIQTYREDRPGEEEENFYVEDPSGNRVQLVRDNETSGAGVTGIDHVCFEDVNIAWAESFYAGILQLPVDHISGARTSDFMRARAWGDGEIEMMPGTCRWVRYYRPIKGQNRMQPRPSLQMYFRAGDGLLGVYMAMDDYAEPPEEQVTGTPRVGLEVVKGGLGSIAARLSAAGRSFDGPVAHEKASPIARSIYCRDSGGHFIEFCER